MVSAFWKQKRRVWYTTDPVPLPERLLRLRRRLLHPVWLRPIRRTTPVSQLCGADRGTPLDRFYIEQFLAEHRQDIHGCVLEVQDSGYTDRYGQGVTRRDVLSLSADNPEATIVANLMEADAIPSDTFDCFILTQTLQYLPDLPAAMGHIWRILRPGGVLLATVPCFNRLELVQPYQDYWRFSAAACSHLFGAVFAPESVTVRPYGNVLVSVAFLMGLATQELSAKELAAQDPSFPIVIAVRAVKQAAGEQR